jgi:hypothetical protein
LVDFIFEVLKLILIVQIVCKSLCPKSNWEAIVYLVSQ